MFSFKRRVLPGFGLTLGCTTLYLSLIVLIPLAALFLRAASMPWSGFVKTIGDPRTLAAFKLTIGAALVASLVNAVVGFVVAWTLVRYRFPGRRFVDALIDLPFALPTAVSGIALAALCGPKGWIGQVFTKTGAIGSLLASLHPSFEIKPAYSQLGVTIALIFIGFPFVVRTLQPALEELDGESEEASASLGASRWQTFRLVILPTVFPALLTGFALAFARSLGEYGSVVFISGNRRMETEITSLLIIEKLEQYDYQGATAIAVVMLLASFVVLLGINVLQWRVTRVRHAGV